MIDEEDNENQEDDFDLNINNINIFNKDINDKEMLMHVNEHEKIMKEYHRKLVLQQRNKNAMQQILKYLKRNLNTCIFCYIHQEHNYDLHTTSECELYIDDIRLSNKIRVKAQKLYAITSKMH